MITKNELYILSYYRACELAGSILFGRLALHTDIDELRIPLTNHCLEEAEHAWLWTKTIKELGHIPVKVTQIYQTEYGKEFGMPQSILEIFCLTQVFEKRTLMHFQRHLDLPNVHPKIKATLQKMIDDESGHLSWIRDALDKHEAARGSNQTQLLLEKLEAIDARIYARIMAQTQYQDYFKE